MHADSIAVKLQLQYQAKEQRPATTSRRRDEDRVKDDGNVESPSQARGDDVPGCLADVVGVCPAKT
jgi:hypothetical protein